MPGKRGSNILSSERFFKHRTDCLDLGLFAARVAAERRPGHSGFPRFAGAGHTLIYYFVKDIRLTEPARETVGKDAHKQTAEPNYLEGKR